MTTSQPHNLTTPQPYNPTTLLLDLETEATQRVLARLEEYSNLVIRPLNMRHRSIELLGVYGNRIEVKVSAPMNNCVLVIAPQSALLAEFFWLKEATKQQFATPRIIAHDLTATQLPFCYMLLNFIGGIALENIDQPIHQRVVARQIGRSLRRIHQRPAPGFGRPLLSGHWPQYGWRETLIHWLDQIGALELALAALGEHDFEQLIADTLDHSDLLCQEPRILHGAISPQRTIITIAEAAQLESLPPPGSIVGGDPLLDLAMALLPSHSTDFRQGFLEGYTALGQLDASQRMRLRRLAVLAILYQAARAGETAENLASTLRGAMAGLQPQDAV